MPAAMASQPAVEVADELRQQAYRLMANQPIAATYLVLAAAAIEPTCPDEREIANQFAERVAEIALYLGIIHRGAAHNRCQ